MAYTGRELIASRCAKFFEDGALVNLGIGIPLLCAKHVPAGVDIFLQAEIGTIGYRSAESPDEWDIDVADAGAKPAVLLPGAALCRMTSPSALSGAGISAARCLARSKWTGRATLPTG